MDEEVIKLLEEEISMVEDCPNNCSHIDAHAHKAGLRQILSLLRKQPVCETCGGSEEVTRIGTPHDNYPRTTRYKAPCPDCPPKEPKHTEDCAFQLEQGGSPCDCGALLKEPNAVDVLKRLTDVINKDYRIVCSDYTDGIKAVDIFRVISDARKVIEQLEAENPTIEIRLESQALDDAAELVKELRASARAYESHCKDPYCSDSLKHFVVETPMSKMLHKAAAIIEQLEKNQCTEPDCPVVKAWQKVREQRKSLKQQIAKLQQKKESKE